METHDDLYEDDEWYEDDPDCAYEYCPCCGRLYGCIDFDYQSCSKCGWDADNNKYNPKIKIEPTQSDYENGDADILTGRWY